MPGQLPMLPAHCRDEAASLLRRAGFVEPAGRVVGGSRYLKEQGGPFKIRVSTHGIRNMSRFRYADVLASIVFTRPHTHTELAARVERAIELFRERAKERIAEAAE